jgi:plastocyanin
MLTWITPDICSPAWAKAVLKSPTSLPGSHAAALGLAVAWASTAFWCAEALAEAAPRVHAVQIEGMRFVPETLTVRRGERIVWTNNDLVPHTVTQAAFDSHAVAPNASWSYVAAKPGTYPYGCTSHPAMRATLIVQ